MIDINKIYNEDCIETMQRMPNDFIDITVTSPPYNVDLDYNDYKDNIDHKKYIDWIKSVFSLLYQKTKIGGRCIINVGDQKNGRISLHTEIINVMNGIGWLNYSIIIWNKNHCNARTAWGSYQNPSQPSFPRPFEFILIFSKKELKLQSKGLTDLTKKQFADWSYGLWTIKPETKKSGHPAAFPIEIPVRCIKMLSWQKSIVYDPFVGSGTTAAACKLTDRNFIGSEIDSLYCEIAKNKLMQYNDFSENSFF